MTAPTTPAGHRSRQEAIRRAIDDTRLDTRLASKRIVALFYSATADEKANGLRWYGDAHHAMLELAEEAGVPTRQAIGVLAALSPGCEWERNKRLARTMLLSNDCAHPFGKDPIGKARRILQGENPGDVLGGRKVRAFYDNLLRPHASRQVTVDRHAFAIMLDEDDRGSTPRGGSLNDTVYKLLDRPGTYQLAALSYRAAAYQLRILPHQVQAVTWCAHRRLKEVPQ